MPPDDAPNDTPPPRTPWRDAWHDIAPHLDLGWRLMSAVAVPPLLGWGVDALLHIAPWGLVSGAALGLASAAYILVELSRTPPARKS